MPTETDSGNANYAAPAIAISDGVSSSVVARFSSAGMGITVNGSSVTNQATWAGSGTSASTVGLGDDGSGSFGFSGYITRLAIRGTAANDADMQLAGTGGR